MNFQKAVYFLLNMLNESTQVALNRYFKNIGEETHMSQQAFSKTRSHFDHSPWSFLQGFFLPEMQSSIITINPTVNP